MSSKHHESILDSTNGERFRKLQSLTNHWRRPATPRAYYWYLTFDIPPHLRSLVRRCQEAISFPYYDLLADSDLHLTLDRIAFEGNITLDQLNSIKAAAINACEEIPPLNITIGSLGGTSGAIGFSASPIGKIRHLRDTLREATLSIYPDAPIKDSEFHPHVTIAYCNASDVSATQAVAAVEKLSGLTCADVTAKEGALVLLERRKRSYSWEAIFHIPLSGR
ncbi:2'-5' RNA ligase family protein [Nonomuraea typhae]|uniref:2'-5' RNA ligase family protein n=1 Tax=Nonomuraea typhae TaxID=2603600 RepID=A0ABW7Z305_9ACTN